MFCERRARASSLHGPSGCCSRRHIKCPRTDSRCQQSLLSFLPSAPCRRPSAVANIMALQRAELRHPSWHIPGVACGGPWPGALRPLYHPWQDVSEPSAGGDAGEQRYHLFLKQEAIDGATCGRCATQGFPLRQAALASAPSPANPSWHIAAGQAPPRASAGSQWAETSSMQAIGATAVRAAPIVSQLARSPDCRTSWRAAAKARELGHGREGQLPAHLSKGSGSVMPRRWGRLPPAASAAGHLPLPSIHG